MSKFKDMDLVQVVTHIDSILASKAFAGSQGPDVAEAARSELVEAVKHKSSLTGLEPLPEGMVPASEVVTKVSAADAETIKQVEATMQSERDAAEVRRQQEVRGYVKESDTK